MGPCINEQQLKTVMDYVEIGKNEGAKLLTRRARLETARYAKGWFHEPTVFGDCDAKMRIAQEEIFGPVVSVIPIGSFDEAIEMANGVTYGLSASIYTRDVNRAFQAMRDLYTGIVYVNAPTIGGGDAFAFRRHQANGQRPSRSGDCGDRFLFRVEDAVHRLFGQTSARADRQQLEAIS